MNKLVLNITFSFLTLVSLPVGGHNDDDYLVNLRGAGQGPKRHGLEMYSPDNKGLTPLGQVTGSWPRQPT